MKLTWLLGAFLLCLAPALFAQDPQLKKLRDEDQAVRANPELRVARSDEDRIKLVLQLLAEGKAQTSEDKYNAAIVLQHTPADFCGKRLVSTSPDNYLLAHYLAEQAFAGGYKDARLLVAQSIDRYLSFTKGYQMYGTNRFVNQKTGREELVPIDRKVPDSERAKYGVPPLRELLKEYPEQSSTEDPESH